MEFPKNPWFGISLALAGVIVGYTVTTSINSAKGIALNPLPLARPPQPSPSQAPTPPPASPPARNVPPVDAERDHIRGNPEAAFSVIEYSDFECPFCKRHHPTMVQLLEEEDDVNWVYRHFPLGFHQNAEPAAIASECVNEQGGNDAFWKFTDKIFETQGEWAYESYVTDLGLDVAKFNECVRSGKFAQRVREDMQGGSAAGVTGTPGNIVLHHKTGEARIVSGAQPLASFTSAMDAMRGGGEQAMKPMAPSGQNRMIMVDVDNWSFSPSTIRVNQGDRVVLHLSGVKGNHGFAVPGLGIDQSVGAGEMPTVMVPTDKPGEYDFFCNRLCGSGHKDMKGKIIIDASS